MMKLTLYILRQITVPFLGLTLFFTALLFIIRAVDSLEQVVINGQSADVWVNLLLYALPLVLARSMPFALLLGLMIGLVRLMNDNELPMMFAAGVGRLRLARAPFILAAVVMVLVAALELYGTPWGLRKAREEIFFLRADMAASMIRPGSFVSPTRGITLFVSDYDMEGTARGLLLQDDRNSDQSITYIAETGSLRRSGQSVVLLMFNGTIHHLNYNRPGGTLTVASFSQYTYDLAEFMEGMAGISYRLRDLYPAQLLAEQGERRAAAQALFHTRLSAALYCLAYALILMALLPVGSLRQYGYGWRVGGAGLICITTRLLGYGIGSRAVDAPALLPFLYLLPISAMIAAIAILLISSLRAEVPFLHLPASVRGGR